MSAELLPVAPEGWRLERLDLSLTFAPDLGFEGFEELRFAPGMFDPDSPSYFSYVMALRLDGDHDVTPAFWKEFLSPYYRGLCAAVGAGKDLEVSPEDSVIDVVQRDDRVCVATIDMVDAFVTAKALRLRIELESYSTPRATELFGVVSPMPEDAAVWDELAGVREHWRAARSMPVFFNHLFVIPDSETYAAIAESEFLRSFGFFESRTTVRQDMSYEGIYWYGTKTYFEFLPPSGAQLAEGGTKDLAERLAAVGVKRFAGPRTRQLDGEDLPWFEIMGIEGASMTSRLNLFTLEYDPTFLERWHPELAPARPGISRRRILTRYAAAIEPADEPLFEDVKEIFLSLDEAERVRIDAVC